MRNVFAELMAEYMTELAHLMLKATRRRKREMDMPNNPGGFIISLDFELHWGVRDHRSVTEYRERLLGERHAVPAILALFERYRIHATWATVGFLFFESIEDLKASLPDELPKYRDARLDPYATISELGRDEHDDPVHFAPSLIRRILACEGQELGTHTLSHFYTLASGPSLDSFRADLRGAKSIAARYGKTLRSIVFPRNQLSRKHLRLCAEEGLLAYRSSEADPWIQKGNTTLGRLLRFADSYAGLSGDGCFTPCHDDEAHMVKISSSRFLRPWSAALTGLEELRLRRICASMDIAAASGRSYHLWWHPHNFGINLDKNMHFLARIAEHYAELHRRTGWPSRSMGEVAENVMRIEAPRCMA